MSDHRHIVTFKAEDVLVKAMQGIPNRSEFIRSAILAALDGACPLCRGTGVLSQRQRQHWEEFSSDHSVEACTDCREIRIVCKA